MGGVDTKELCILVGVVPAIVADLHEPGPPAVDLPKILIVAGHAQHYAGPVEGPHDVGPVETADQTLFAVEQFLAAKTKHQPVPRLGPGCNIDEEVLEICLVLEDEGHTAFALVSVGEFAFYEYTQPILIA